MSERKPRGPKPEKVTVSEKQEEILEKIIRRPSTKQQLAQRARIVVACGKEGANQHIADDEKITVTTVKKWRRRWRGGEDTLAEIEAEGTQKELAEGIGNLLTDEQRSGTPVTFTAEQVCKIIAIACEKPEESERPVTRWTPKELADEAIKRGIVRSISARQVGRFLKRSRSETSPKSVLVD